MTEVSGPSRKASVVAAVLFVGTVLLFSRAWRHEFVNYDDPDYVTANAHVKGGLTAAGVRWAFGNDNISYWHPLTWISHMADWELFGGNPRGHHAVSVGWHALNAALAFLALRRLTGAFWTSAIAAALFAWHPLRVESVAWVAERKDVLSGFFWLATLWAYAIFAERKRENASSAWPWYGTVLGLFACGLMSKPMLVSVPCVLLVLDGWPLRRWTRKTWPALLAEKVPFVALSAVVSWRTMVAQEKVGTLTDALSLPARLANAAVAVSRYLGKFFAPFDLAVLYPHPGTWPDLTIALAVALILAVSGIAIWQARRRPWLLAGWLWFLVALLPVSGVKQVGIQSMADRYTYLPMIGIVIAILWTLREIFRRQPAWRGGVTAALALGACLPLTWRQLGVWQNSFTLFDHAIAVTKRNYLAHNNRGLFLFHAGKVEEALADYRRSLAINPRYLDANNNLGHALAELGRPAEAIPFYRAALDTKPDHVEVRNNLANALSDLGQVEDAMSHYEFVLAREPNHVNALNGYGVALAMKGRLAEAVARFETVLRLAPDNVSAHSNLGNACAMLGRMAEAVEHYRRALALSPHDPRTFLNLGNAYTSQQQFAAAADSYRRAVQLAPVNPEAHASLGFALAQLGRREEALRHLRTALQQRPDFSQAQAWLQAIQAAPATK